MEFEKANYTNISNSYPLIGLFTDIRGEYIKG
jgi:hypothetical protein